MKKLLRFFASAGFLDPSTKTGRASGRTARKSLIINDQILRPPPKSSGNVRFCAFTPPIPDLSGVIRTFAQKPRASAGHEWKTATFTPALTAGAIPPKSLHRVALCCSVLHRVSPKNLSDLRCNTFAFPIEPVHGGTAGMRPLRVGFDFCPDSGLNLLIADRCMGFCSCFHGFRGLLNSTRWIWVAALFVGAPDKGLAQAALSYSVQVQPGINSIANHLNRGDNNLDDVLRGVPEGSVLYKFNSVTMGYDVAVYDNGNWHPPEFLRPGEGAFLQIPGNQTITLTFSGTIATQFPLPRQQVNWGGYNLVSAHQPRPMNFVELFGFTPHPGDVVYLYEKPLAAAPSPTQPNAWSTHRFTPRGWDFFPTFRVGRSAFVYLSQGPRIWQHPMSRNVTNGQTVRFDVGVTGPGVSQGPGPGQVPYRFQWLRQEDDLVGETNSFLLINNVQYWHSGLYSVTVRNPFGEVTSRQAFLQVTSPPVILEPPEGVRAIPGQKVTFRVNAVGTPILRYEWFRDGVRLPNQILPLLEVTASAATAGRYHVRVVNNLGFAQSQPVTLELNDPPKIIVHPITQIARPNETVAFTVVAEGTQPLSYQWRHNGQRIPGGTNSTLVVSKIQPEDAGEYDVVVVNVVGVAHSEVAFLILDVLRIPLSDSFVESLLFQEPTFILRSDNFGMTREDDEPFHCDRDGTNSVWLKWRTRERGIVRFDTSGSSFDTVIAAYEGKTLPELTTVACDDDDQGKFFGSAIQFVAVPDTIYHIAIDGLDGATGHIILNWEFEPTDESLPIIRQQPQDQTARLGDQRVTFFVTVDFNPNDPPFFQWFRNGIEIPGATTPELTVPFNPVPPRPITRADLGFYHVEILQGRRFVKSRAATLQISVGGVENNLLRVFAVDKFADAVVRQPRQAPFVGGGGGGVQSVATTAFTPILGYTGTQIFSTGPFKGEPGELSHCGIPGGSSAWFTFVATNTGRFYLNTAGSTFNTVLGVRRGPGPTIATLTNVICDNDSGPGTTSSLNFPVQENDTYYIAVDGYNGATGDAQLNYRLLIPMTLTETTKTNDTLCTFKVTATPSYPFTIQRCVGLSGWTTVLTTNRPNGIFDYSDTNATVEKRFYRALQTP